MSEFTPHLVCFCACQATGGRLAQRTRRAVRALRPEVPGAAARRAERPGPRGRAGPQGERAAAAQKREPGSHTFEFLFNSVRLVGGNEQGR